MKFGGGPLLSFWPSPVQRVVERVVIVHQADLAFGTDADALANVKPDVAARLEAGHVVLDVFVVVALAASNRQFSALGRTGSLPATA